MVMVSVSKYELVWFIINIEIGTYGGFNKIKTIQKTEVKGDAERRKPNILHTLTLIAVKECENVVSFSSRIQTSI